VIGAASGIGAATPRELAARGELSFAVDINEADPNMQRSGPNHVEHPVDVHCKD